MDKEAIAHQIIRKLLTHGFDSYLAGGCVRDKLRGVPPKDFDIATAARPEQIQSLFGKTIPVGVQFGVILVVEQDTVFEVATFRTDGAYLDGRHPQAVKFASLGEDAQRRDFTVNGMYLDIRTNTVIDLVEGQRDLREQRIRTIGNAALRFSEDHLRMLRAVRFANQLNFQIEPTCDQVIRERASDILKVSRERIRDELLKILGGPNPGVGFRLLDNTGLLAPILPEMITMKGVEQPAEFHPEGDVFIHTLYLLDQLSFAPIELALGALLHDVAKPATFERAKDRIRFHGHDKLGAEMGRDICRRLALPNDTLDLVCALIAEHLRFKDVFNMRLSTLKRFLSMPRFDLHLELHRLDCNASHGKMDAYQFCQKKLDEFSKLPPPPLRLITGEDLKKLGYVPGPLFSKIIRACEDATLEGEITDKEHALKWVTEHYPQKGR